MQQCFKNLNFLIVSSFDFQGNISARLILDYEDM